MAPPFAVHDAHNQDERQNVATFIANLALFQQRLCYARNVSKIGKYIEFDETCHQSRSYQNVMINFRRTACRRCGQRRIAIDSRRLVLSKYSIMSKQWTSSYGRSESPSVAESTK